MTIASVGSIGTNNSAVSGTSLTLTPAATVEVGHFALLVIGFDNLNLETNLGAAGENGLLDAHISSITDTGGNAWHLLSQHATLPVAAASGAGVAVAISKIATELDGTDTITITFRAAIVAKAVSGWEFTATDLTVERIARWITAVDLPARTLDDLPSREYLLLRAAAVEQSTVTFTPSTNYTAMGVALANGGSQAASIAVKAEFRIATLTSDTSDPDAASASRDAADLYLALWESDEPTIPWVVSGRETGSVGSVAVPWPPHEVGDIGLLIVTVAGTDANPALDTANGFAAVANSPQAATGVKLGAFWCRATSASMSAPVVADAGDHVLAQMLVLRGCKPTGDPYTLTGGGIENTSDTSAAIPGITTTAAEQLILAIGADGIDAGGGTTGIWGSISNTGLTRLIELGEARTNIGALGSGCLVAVGRKAAAGATGDINSTLTNATTKAFLTLAFGVPVAPSAPVLTVGATTDDSIDLSWTNVGDETGYRIERSLDGSTGWVDLGDNAADDTTFTDTGLTCETEYFYRIFAFNGVGDSAASNVDSGTTDSCPVPAAPSNLVATAVATDQINLAWDDNSADETGFRVERSLDGVGGWADVSGNLPPGTEAFSNSGLTCGTQYFYRVFAFNASGDSTASNSDDATTSACPPPGGANQIGGTGAIRKPPRIGG